jgi:hypothetical protein
MLRLKYRLKTMKSGCEYLVMNEWSEGHRHVHILVRAEANITPPMVRALWAKTLPGPRFHHHCAPVRNPVGMARYLVKDLKDDTKKELVPQSFRGRHFTYSRRFFTGPVAALWRQQLQAWYPTKRHRLLAGAETNHNHG